MFAGYQFFLIGATVLLSGSAAANSATLTKGNIPPNLSPELTRLIEQTFSSDARERAEAARRIGEMRDRAAAAAPFLIRLLDDNVCPLYYHVDNALLAIGNAALDPCISAAKTGQPGAILCLGRFGCAKAVDALLELLKSANSETRRTALIALTHCTDTRATLPILSILENSSGEMRRIAIYCFQRLHDPRTVEPLLKVLKDRNVWESDLLMPTVIALGCQRDRRAVPALLDILKNSKEDEWLRHSAAQALGRIGDPSIFPILVDTLQDRKAPVVVRSGAALGIGAYRASAGELPLDGKHHARIPTLLGSVLNSEDEPLDLRASAAQALGEFGSPEAVKLLIPVADSRAHDALGFWAAVSAVKLTNGAIRDVGVVRAIRNYHAVVEGDGVDLQEQRDALEKIAEHGATWRVRLAVKGLDWLFTAILATIGVVAVGAAVVWFIKRKRRRSAKADAAQ